MKKIFSIFLMLLLCEAQSFAYSDENLYIWAVPAINRWRANGVINGYPDDTFRGEQYVSRADLAIIANRLNNSDEKYKKKVANDVYEDDYFFSDMATAVSRGLIKTDKYKNLRPREAATREDTMVIFANLFGLNYSGNSIEYLTSNFTDGDKVNYDNVNKVAGFIDAGFISGYPDNTLRPQGFVTRAEIISMLDKAIEDVYGEGKYSNKIINKSIIINEPNVRINNSEIRNRVFVLDGANAEQPIFTNTNIGVEICSRVGEIVLKRDDTYETLTQKGQDDYNEPLFGYVKYSPSGWTNDEVEATLKLDSKRYEVVNNNGKDYKLFRKNGTFTFECENDGTVKSFVATVSNIDKTKPVINVDIVPGQTTAQVTLSIEDDGFSPIERVSYSKGNVSAEIAISGNKILNNSCEIAGKGYFTIAALDEAGNIGSLVVEVNNEKDIFIVTFNANGGVGTMDTQSFVEGVEGKLNINTFAKEGSTFNGWNTDPDGSGTAYLDESDFTALADTVLYAQWNINP